MSLAYGGEATYVKNGCRRRNHDWSIRQRVFNGVQLGIVGLGIFINITRCFFSCIGVELFNLSPRSDTVSSFIICIFGSCSNRNNPIFCIHKTGFSVHNPGWKRFTTMACNLHFHSEKQRQRKHSGMKINILACLLFFWEKDFLIISKYQVSIN